MSEQRWRFFWRSACPLCLEPGQQLRWRGQEAGLRPSVCLSSSATEQEGACTGPPDKDCAAAAGEIKINSCAPRRMRSTFHALIPPLIPPSRSVFQSAPHPAHAHPASPPALARLPAAPSHTPPPPSRGAGATLQLSGSTEDSGRVAGGGWRGGLFHGPAPPARPGHPQILPWALPERPGNGGGLGRGGEIGEAEAGPGSRGVRGTV